MSAVTARPLSTPTPQTAHCPACGSASALASRAWKFVNARGETEWLRCSSCKSFFMDGEYDLQQETEHTQQMTWGDAHHGAQLNQFKQRMYQAILTQLVARTIPYGQTLVDVGCSYGGFLAAARETGFDVCGYDIVPEAVRYTQVQGLNAQCCGSMRDFTLLQKPADVITVLDANIYWPDQPDELRAIYDRLKPGGLLVMRVVDKSWMARIGAMLQSVSRPRADKILRRAVNDHRFSMPLGSFLGILRRTGFRVLSASPKGAVHSDQTSLPVRLSFGIGTALWQTLGVFVAPGAVIFAEKPA